MKDKHIVTSLCLLLNSLCIPTNLSSEWNGAALSEVTHAWVSSNCMGKEISLFPTENNTCSGNCAVSSW
jgi:hypothetical protein